MKKITLIVLCLISISLYAKDNKIALVIGNSNYKNISRLTNPINDAKAVATRLKKLGFKLLKPVNNKTDAQFDLSEEGFILAQEEFLRASRNADIALLYYAGHGMQIAGEPILLPIGVPKPNSNLGIRMIKRKAIRLEEMLPEGNQGLVIGIFDACREIPELKERGTSSAFRGLARPKTSGKNRIIAYSAASGQLAADGGGKNSPYTTTMLAVLDKSPHEEIGDLFRNIATKMKSTMTGQKPELLIQGVPPHKYFFSILGKSSAKIKQLMHRAMMGDMAAIKSLQSNPEFLKLMPRTQNNKPQTDQLAVLATATEQVSDNKDQKALAQAMKAYQNFNEEGRTKLEKMAENGNVFAGMMLERSYRNGVTGIIKNTKKAKRYQHMKKKAYRLLKPLYETGDNIALSWQGNLFRDNDNNEIQAKAMPFFRKAASNDFVYAQQVLAYMYQNGKGVKKDYKKALKWNLLMVNNNVAHNLTFVALGQMYQNGWGVDKDYDEAVKWFRKAAEQGNVYGQNNLGYMHEKGLGVDKDYDEAVKWYRKSAEQGNSYGQNHLGRMYQSGLGVKKDYDEAVKWYRKSTKQGNIDGQNNLGYMHEKGLGVDQDYGEAIKWYSKSAEQGNSYGQNHLGLMYFGGLGVSHSDHETVKWWKKAADQKNSEGLFNMGWMYEKGRGVEQDYSKAKELYLQAAEKGNNGAQHNLGNMYENAMGVEKDYKKASFWYKKAAKQGNVGAQRDLGKLYESGHGVEQDYNKALIWYKKAANQNNIWSQKTLAKSYMSGELGELDESKAFKWFKKAAESGDGESQSAVGQMYHEGTGIQQDYQKAFEWYLKGAEKGHPVAQHNVGNMYRSGVGTDTNQAKAVYWCTKAANQNIDSAQYLLGGMYARGLGVDQDYDEAAFWIVSAISKNSDFFDILFNNTGTVFKYSDQDTSIAEVDILDNPLEHTGFRKALQRRLKELDLYTGKIDGKIGKGTRKALQNLAGRL